MQQCAGLFSINPKSEHEQSDADHQTAIRHATVDLPPSGTEAKVSPLVVPEPEAGRRRERAKQPEVPHLRAMPEHLAAVADRVERADADVQSIGEQTKTREEPQHEGAPEPNGGRDGPGQQRSHYADKRAGPDDDEGIRVMLQVRPRDG